MSGQYIIDSGAIYHYSGISTIFSTLNPSTSLGKINLAYVSSTPVVGSGTVKGKIRSRPISGRHTDLTSVLRLRYNTELEMLEDAKSMGEGAAIESSRRWLEDRSNRMIGIASLIDMTSQ
ncbi:hypothetical protein RND71_001887 [Anisodus tanguticus]|uniref:Retrovirus-related Pol polyprotein from transposon TNT 1-94-like beta-barrel domain-containing protein n=1 Tax=Anisodus tanguticus TaxID=243964 RepID=A0AAE1T0Z6_9SOLA|nr:hypothetical protein RND71_001887 [Anisodus tanguticus]